MRTAKTQEMNADAAAFWISSVGAEISQHLTQGAEIARTASFFDGLKKKRPPGGRAESSLTHVGTFQLS